MSPGRLLCRSLEHLNLQDQHGRSNVRPTHQIDVRVERDLLCGSPELVSRHFVSVVGKTLQIWNCTLELLGCCPSDPVSFLPSSAPMTTMLVVACCTATAVLPWWATSSRLEVAFPLHPGRRCLKNSSKLTCDDAFLRLFLLSFG